MHFPGRYSLKVPPFAVKKKSTYFAKKLGLKKDFYQKKIVAKKGDDMK